MFQKITKFIFASIIMVRVGIALAVVGFIIACLTGNIWIIILASLVIGKRIDLFIAYGMFRSITFTFYQHLKYIYSRSWNIMTAAENIINFCAITPWLRKSEFWAYLLSHFELSKNRVSRYMIKIPLYIKLWLKLVHSFRLKDERWQIYII